MLPRVNNKVTLVCTVVCGPLLPSAMHGRYSDIQCAVIYNLKHILTRADGGVAGLRACVVFRCCHKL